MTLFLLFGCEETENQSSAQRSAALSPPVGASFSPLSPAFLQRSTHALERYLQFDSLLLEVRAEGDTFTLQLKASPQIQEKLGSQIVQVMYSERPGEPGQPPVGKIEGPTALPMEGRGELEENLYRFDELNLPQMARAFSVAKRAIDPTNGQIERLVVRRYLPFSERIRGRIFVVSPRMNGSIDVNEKGQPLRR